MKLIKYIKDHKVSTLIIIILSILLITTTVKYSHLKAYVDGIIYVESWSFAASNHSIILMLEEKENLYADQIEKCYYQMYEDYNELFGAYSAKFPSMENLTFDNNLAKVHDQEDKSKMLAAHKQVEEILSRHKVSYKDLESIMHSRDVDYRQLLVDEWEDIMLELNQLDFYE